ncbi:MAG: YegS/Rv2252/BmrU family lipid kinase [Clostridium sp.]|nr:YegS/Rv2252/BmrU family lipid kinase [Clostridium sp.]
MKKKALFIFNPHAGKGQVKSRLLDVVDVLTKDGYDVTVHPTQSRGDAVTVVSENEGIFDLCVCAGGDGTLDEVVTGMMQNGTRVPIGYIPTGSTNDFASSLKIPKKAALAVETAVHGREFLCDIGRFNEDVFVYIAAFGLFTDVSYETKQEVKNVLGHMAYILEGMKRLSAIKSYHMTVTADGKQMEGDYLYGMVTNSHSVGGFQNITGKNVELNDGLFEVTLIKRPRNAVELNQIMAALIGAHFDTELMSSFKAADVIFETPETIPWTLDGEYGGDHRRVKVHNEHHAIRFLVP